MPGRLSDGLLRLKVSIFRLTDRFLRPPKRIFRLANRFLRLANRVFRLANRFLRLTKTVCRLTNRFCRSKNLLCQAGKAVWHTPKPILLGKRPFSKKTGQHPAPLRWEPRCLPHREPRENRRLGSESDQKARTPAPR